MVTRKIANSTAWTYDANGLPATCPAASYALTTTVPNIYVGP